MEIASWVLDQARDLSQPGVNVEQLPVFQVAGALKSTPTDKKQVLVQRAVAGFSDLPVHQRAEAVRLAMRSGRIMQQADTLEVTRLAEREHAAAMQRLRALEERQAAREGRPTQQQMSHGQEHFRDFGHQQEPLVENLLRVAKEAKFNEMPPEELRGMAQTVRGQARTLMQPQQLLDVVQELNQDEREQLTEALVEANVVPEEQRGVLEEAVRPGGYADKLGALLRFAAKAREYAWVFIVLPIAEFVLAIILGSLTCGTPLIVWLRVDSLLALCAAATVVVTGFILAPVYRKLNEDPVGAVQRWQMPLDARGPNGEYRQPTWKARLEATVPGVDFDTYRFGGVGIIAIVLLVLLGAVWAVLGVIYLVATMIFGCAAVTTFLCILFIGVRFACVVALLWGLYYILDEIQRHRSRSPMLGSSLLPMSEDAYPRGQYDPLHANRPPGRPP